MNTTHRDFYLEGMVALAMTNDAAILRDLPAHQLQTVCINRFTWHRLMESIRAKLKNNKENNQ